MSEYEAILPYLAGPGAAVLVLLVVFGAIYQIAVKYGIPLIERIANRHLDQIDKLIAGAEAHHRETMDKLNALHKRAA